MMRRQFLFFDLGWTLEDETKSQIDRAKKAAQALKNYQIDISYEEILKLQEEGASRFAPSVYRYAIQELGLSDDAIDEIISQTKWDKNFLFLYDDAVATLDILKKYHFLGIIANQSPGTIERLERYKIRDKFDLVFASAELGLSKPDPRIFQLAAEKSDSNPADTWMIGDRIDNDIKPAKSAGWRTIRVLNGYNTLQEPRSPEEMADYTIKKLSEIPNIVNHR